MKIFDLVRRYANHPDAQAEAANWVALMVGSNTPFYPLYLLAMPGHGIFPAGWLTLCATPFFLTVPAVARIDPLLGRLFLLAVGTANSVFVSWILGPGSSTYLFLLPCAILAALLYRPTERLLRLAVLGVVLAAFLLCVYWLPSLTGLAPDTQAALTRLNAFSVLCLTAFLALTFAPLFGKP